MKRLLLSLLSFVTASSLFSMETLSKTPSLNELKREALVCISPDGSFAAVAQGNVIKVWDIKAKKVRYSLKDEKHRMKMVRFSPDGCYLVYVGTNEEGVVINRWKFKNDSWSECVRSLFPGDDCLISFSPDGKLLVIMQIVPLPLNRQSIELYDMRTKDLQSYFQLGPIVDDCKINAVCFGSDGKTLRVFMIGSVGTIISILNLKNRAEIGHIKHLFRDHVDPLCISPDGSKIAFVKDKTSIEIKNLMTLPVQQADTILYCLVGHSDEITCAAFSPDGRSLVSGSKDGTARLWDITTGEQVHLFGGVKCPIKLVSFGQNNRSLMLVSEQGRVDIARWD